MTPKTTSTSIIWTPPESYVAAAKFYVEALIEAATKRSGTGMQEYDAHTGKYASHFPSVSELKGVHAPTLLDSSDVKAHANPNFIPIQYGTGGKAEWIITDKNGNHIGTVTQTTSLVGPSGQASYVTRYVPRLAGESSNGVGYSSKKAAQEALVNQHNNKLSKAKPHNHYIPVGGPLGSNGGQWYENTETGQKFLVKPAKSLQHAENEVAMGQIYREAGIDVPRTRFEEVSPGHYVVISEGIDFVPAQDLPKSQIENMQIKARQGFGVDALTSNWDVYGLTGDNAGLDPGSGSVIRIDAGGAGLFRAQGGPKDSFAPNKEWTEPSTMRVSDQGKAFYGPMSDAEAATSLGKAYDLDLSNLDARMEAVGISQPTRLKILQTVADRQKQIPNLQSKLGGMPSSPLSTQQTHDLAKATEAAKAVHVPPTPKPAAPAKIITSSKHGDVIATGFGGQQIQVGGGVTMGSGKTFTVVGPGSKPGYIHVKTGTGHSLAVKQADVKSVTPAGIKVGHGLEVHPGSKVVTGKGKIFTVVGPGKSDEYLHVKTESGHSLAIKKNDVKPHGLQTPPGGFASDKPKVTAPKVEKISKQDAEELATGGTAIDQFGTQIHIGSKVQVNSSGVEGEVIHIAGSDQVQVHLPNHPEGAGTYHHPSQLEVMSGPEPISKNVFVSQSGKVFTEGDQFQVKGLTSVTYKIETIDSAGGTFTYSIPTSIHNNKIQTANLSQLDGAVNKGNLIKPSTPSVPAGVPDGLHGVKIGDVLDNGGVHYTVTGVTDEYVMVKPPHSVGSPFAVTKDDTHYKPLGTPGAEHHKTLADMKKGDVLEHKWYPGQEWVVTSVSANGMLNVKKKEHYGKPYGGVYKVKPNNTSYFPKGSAPAVPGKTATSHVPDAPVKPIPPGGHKMLTDVYTPPVTPKPVGSLPEAKIKQIEVNGNYNGTEKVTLDVGGHYIIHGTNKKGEQFTETIEVIGPGPAGADTFVGHPKTGYWANTPDKTFVYNTSQFGDKTPDGLPHKVGQTDPKITGNSAHKMALADAADPRHGQGFVHLHPPTAVAANPQQSEQVRKAIASATGVEGTSGTHRGKRAISNMKNDDPEGYKQVVSTFGSEAGAQQWAQSVLSAWDGSSGSSEAVAMQHAIASRFGIPVGRQSAGGQMEWTAKAKEYAALRDAVYADTQRQLAAQGVRSLTVYRGVSSHPGLHNGTQQTVKLHAASSFTTSPQKAKGFGGSHVLVANVESERIFSLGGTGFGWYGSGSEREVVVMGSNSGVVVDVFHPGSLPTGASLNPTPQPVLAKMW